MGFNNNINYITFCSPGSRQYPTANFSSSRSSSGLSPLATPCPPTAHPSRFQPPNLFYNHFNLSLGFSSKLADTLSFSYFLLSVASLFALPCVHPQDVDGWSQQQQQSKPIWLLRPNILVCCVFQSLSRSSITFIQILSLPGTSHSAPAATDHPGCLTSTSHPSNSFNWDSHNQGGL